jgi:hypothetical protein
MGFKSFARFVALAVLLLGSVVSVYADVYGSISGYVRDSSGAPLPGVTVTVTGPVLPKARDIVTDSSGNYSFIKLPPGTYTVTAALAGLGTTRADAMVVVDKDTSLNLKLTPAVSESITVSAAAPTVDMKSTEVNFNYDAKTIEKLPLSRSYQGLFQLAPGVPAGTGFAPVAGGGRQENLFLLDGASVTNPSFGYLGIGNTDMNELDVADFNVKRAGFTAESGRSTGEVVNAVTKSGTNELQGAVREEFRPGSWAATAKDPSFASHTNVNRTEANIGGPIWRDHIFGYASGRYEKINTTNRTNFFGPVPDEKQTIKELFGKITAAPTASQFLALGYRHIPLVDPNTGVGTYDLPETAFDFKNTNRVATADYTWNATKDTLVEAKVLRSSEANHFVAQTDLGFKPPFNVNDLRHMGSVSITDPGGSGKLVHAGAYYVRLSTQDYKNNSNSVAVSQFFDFGGMNHQVKAGVGYQYGEEHLSRLSNGWGSISVLTNGTIRASYYPDQPALLGFGKTYSAYVQDSITVTPRLNVNLGVLANRDDFGQKWQGQTLTFLKFGFGDEIQPRIGINYNLRANTGDKIYANFGRYSGMDQKSTSRGLAPHTIISSTAIFNATTGALISDRPSAGESGNATIDPSTKPTYTDEFLTGYATPFASVWSLDTFFMFRNSKNFIEDHPIVMPDGGPDGIFVASNIPAKRRYYGVTVDLNRRLANRWMAEVNYTWSRLYGNYDIDYSGGALYNTASAIEDGPGIMVEDPFRWGPLLNNRTHVLKAFGAYEVIPNLNVGAYYRFQSGAPWNALGRDATYFGFRRYLNTVGTYHTSAWNNVDLLAQYAVPLSRGIRVSLEGRVLNVLNKQTVLSVDRVQYFDTPSQLPNPPYITPQGTTLPNPNFGNATSYADPRRYIASVRVDF